MLLGFFQSHSSLRLFVQKALKQTSKTAAEIALEFHIFRHDLIFNILTTVGRVTNDHFIQAAAQTPYVYGEIVAFFIVDFWSQIL